MIKINNANQINFVIKILNNYFVNLLFAYKISFLVDTLSNSCTISLNLGLNSLSMFQHLYIRSYNTAGQLYNIKN